MSRLEVGHRAVSSDAPVEAAPSGRAARDRRVVWLFGAAVIHHVVIGSLFGLGDAEALYVVYGRRLQGGYLDHPPLVGVVTGLVGAVLGESASSMRLVSAFLFGAALLGADFATRAMGGSGRAGLTAAAAVLLVPMFTAGSMAIAPDVLIAPLVFTLLVASWRAIEKPTPWRAFAVGAILGVAFLAKYTALLLAPGLFLWALRAHTRLCHLILAILAALAVASPVIGWNAARGWPSLWHRLWWSQPDIGLSLRNVGALLGGQLLYVGPPMLVLFLSVLMQRRSPSAIRIPALGALIGAVALCLLSRVAEPHWTAIAYLPACVGLGLRADSAGRHMRRTWRAAIVWTVFVLAVLHLYVLTPLAPAIAGPSYAPEMDIANELHGWPEVGRAVSQVRRQGEVVAATHYTLCAQLEIALGRASEVRCISDAIDDWDLWGLGTLSRSVSAVLVTDSRYPARPASSVLIRTVRVRRGGRVVRTFRLYRIAAR